MNLNFSRKEIIVYAIIAIIIVVGVAVIASGVIHNSISVSVKLHQEGQVSYPIYPYQSAFLVAQINNTGNTQINNLVLETYVNGQELHTYTVDLPPGTGVQVNITYPYPYSGAFQFQAVADPGHLLNVVNRSASSASLTYNVTAEQQPNVYLSIPNNNIRNTETFSLQSYGLDQALFISTQFNTSYFNKMVDMNNTPTLRILEDLSAYINAVNGAYTIYDNSSSAYVAWIQGVVGPASMQTVISSFGLNTKAIANGAGFFTALSNTASLCAVYSNGWTKLVQYNNGSTPSTCMSITNTTYAATQANVLVDSLKAYPSMSHYQGLFIYTNSTSTGSALSYTNTISAMSMFEVSNSFFASYISRNPATLNVSSFLPKCLGTISISGNSNICSYGLSPSAKANVSSYYLVNSTEINQNYTITLYSLVNVSLATQAQLAGIALINYLNLTGPSAVWKSVFNSTCSFNGDTPPCNVTSFNIATKNVSMVITNPFTKPIKLNSISCYLFTLANQTINQTVAAGQNTTVNTQCTGSIPGLFNPLNTYDLQLNYTLNGTVQIVNGTLGIPT